MSRNYAEILEGKYIKDDESCHFGDCTEKTTDIIFKLFQPATQKESKAVSLFFIDHLTFVLIPYIMYQGERIISATAAVFYE